MISSIDNRLPSYYTAATDDTDVPEAPQGPAQPTTGSPTSLSDATKTIGRDEFLKLLVAQLRNQDPLNPMDGKDMAAQLAQFSSVEQLMQINTEMTAQADSQKQMLDSLDQMAQDQNDQGYLLAQLIQGQMAVSTVGKIGVLEGNQVFVDRDGNGSLTIDAGALKGEGRVTVIDSKGVSHYGAVPNVDGGVQTFDVRDMGFDPPLEKGSYTFRFDVKPENGEFQAVKTFTTGRISGLKYDNGNPVLIIGDSLSVPFSQLLQVRS